MQRRQKRPSLPKGVTNKQTNQEIGALGMAPATVLNLPLPISNLRWFVVAIVLPALVALPYVLIVTVGFEEDKDNLVSRIKAFPLSVSISYVLIGGWFFGRIADVCFLPPLLGFMFAGFLFQYLREVQLQEMFATVKELAFLVLCMCHYKIRLGAILPDVRASLNNLGCPRIVNCIAMPSPLSFSQTPITANAPSKIRHTNVVLCKH